MTIPYSTAPPEHEVKRMSESVGGTDVPFAYTASVEHVSEPQTSSYSTGASNVALSTGAPIIRAGDQPATAVAQQAGDQTEELTCEGCIVCCITLFVFFGVVAFVIWKIV